MKTNFLFFLKSYADQYPTSVPYLSNFRWSREINGVPYTFENSQQIQVLPSITTSNLLPYNFSTPTNSGDYTVNETNLLVVNGSPAGIAPNQLIVGGAIPVGTYVLSLAPTQYTFTVSSANATIGAVYSNNGQNFTVTSTIVAGTTLVCTGSTSVPLSSGTLSLVSGTGDSTITFSAWTASTNITMSQTATSSGTVGISFYTPASFLYMESDQEISMIYNNGSPMALNPFEINGITIPGVFFMNGPCYSLTVTNPGITTANIFLACMG